MRIVGQNYTITLVQTGFNPALSTEDPPTPPPTPERFSLTFYVNAANTPDALNSDTNFYNLQFPYDFIQWNGGPTGSAGQTPTIENDPFSDYRKTSNDTHTYTPYTYTDAFGNNLKRMPPISANLDVTIIVEQGTKIGSNSSFITTIMNPAFEIITGDVNGEPEANQAFTYYASANLSVEIQNSGNVHGGGGMGGQSRIQNDGKNNQAGGGGGGGAGLHQQLSSGTYYPGKGGSGSDGGGGADGSAGKGDDSGASQRPAGGAGGAGAQGGGSARSATAGAAGGSVFAIINTAWHTSANNDYGPRVLIANKSTGFIQSGGGGGGGGGYNKGAGGAGGELASSGSAGGGTNGGAGGVAGIANTLNFGLFNPRSGGTMTITNENSTAGSVKDRTGSY